MTTKHVILTAALEARDSEILGYQINIDNYRLAIEHIGGMTPEDQRDLIPFRDDLLSRLQAERLEQRKARVIRDVIAAQLAEMEPAP